PRPQQRPGRETNSLRRARGVQGGCGVRPPCLIRTQAMAAPYRNLLLETRDGVAFVTVNRPDKLNALNDETMAELESAFEALAGDAQARGVIVTGAGEKAFVAGADIAELAAETPIQGRERSLRGQRVLDRIENLGKPV